MIRRALTAINRLPIGDRPVRYGQDRLYADSLDRYVAALGWSHGWLARRERALIERELHGAMVAVDVGANIGFHTLTMARCVGPAGRVHSVEPDPRNFRLLARAVTEAGHRQVSLHQAAAGDRPGDVPLYLAAVNRGDSRLVEAREPRRRVMVRSVVLDDLLAGERRVDFIKIDVQGAEAAVLAGLRRTLGSYPGLRVLCELSPELLRRAGADAEGFFGPLRQVDLRPHRLGSDGRPVPIPEEAAWEMARSAGYEMFYFAAT